MFEFSDADHRAEHTQSVFVGYFDNVGFFFDQDFANQSVVRHILPRQNNAIAFVENRREFGGNVIDFGVIIDNFDCFRFARNDQTDFALVTRGGGEKIVVTRADAAGVFMIIICQMN